MSIRRPCQRTRPLQPCERGEYLTHIPCSHPSQRREPTPARERAKMAALFGMAAALSGLLQLPGRPR